MDVGWTNFDSHVFTNMSFTATGYVRIHASYLRAFKCRRVIRFFQFSWLAA